MTAPASPSPFFDDLPERIRMALREDLQEAGDVTSEAVFPADHRTCARIIAKETGVLSGGPVVARVFAEIDSTIQIEQLIADGERVSSGDLAFKFEGPTAKLLAAERTALNFLQRLSGIASLTARFVEAARGRISVCDTRKTTPLWRDLEKYAVKSGGGTNHRMGLYDMVMLKDTHADGAGGIEEALRRVASLRPRLQVAAEARTLAEVQAALDAKVDLLMLDNMTREMLREAINRIDGRIPVEITGGVTLETIGELAELGVARVSVGALTHSAKALDFSMRIDL